MEKERALEYWINRYNSAKDYNDIHWDAEERHEHRDYIRAMEWAIKAIEGYTDVQPVKSGRWEYSEKEYGECAWYFCSCCDEPAEQLYNGEPLLSEFCPHCSARMDGGADDENI